MTKPICFAYPNEKSRDRYRHYCPMREPICGICPLLAADTIPTIGREDGERSSVLRRMVKLSKEAGIEI